MTEPSDKTDQIERAIDKLRSAIRTAPDFGQVTLNLVVQNGCVIGFDLATLEKYRKGRESDPDSKQG